MRYLLDTSVLSGLMRKRPEIRGRLLSLGPSHDIVTCPIVRGEILFGIERLPQGRRREQLAERATAALAEVPCESVPEIAGDAYGQIKAARQRLGLALDENDLWMAATAKALGAILVSTDRDFAQIDGLTVEDWTL
jgi:tRNA(fMet)-specific endonuclease VapC